jgi:hypothetical protein
MTTTTQEVSASIFTQYKHRTFNQIQKYFKILCKEKYSENVSDKSVFLLCLTALSYFTFIVNERFVCMNLFVLGLGFSVYNHNIV